MKYTCLILLWSLFATMALPADNLIQSISIVPCPESITPGTGYFTFSGKTDFTVENEEQAEVARCFSALFTQAAGFTPSVKVGEKKGKISFLTDDALKSEAYHLEITPRQIIVKASDTKGFFYALQTIRQLLPASIEGTAVAETADWSVPAMTIKDEPRFGYRGLMVDVARFFIPKENLLRIIDCMGMLKINTLHLHLVDDNGWRIEIKRYPLLTEIGSRRVDRPGKSFPERRNPRQGEPTVEKGFYTQEDIREIVAYAARHQVEVIPEIEMPAHSNAALASYPHLACGDQPGPFRVAEWWGIYEDVYCAGKEETFRFLEDVLTEVMELFPGKYIHIGGDECPKERWKKCAYCQKRIKEEGLKDEFELQSYFVKRIEKFVNEKGREIIGWDEILEGGLAPRATVMNWRDTSEGIKAARQHHDVIMAPNAFLYFDYIQGDRAQEPLAIGWGYNPTERVYVYEPVPEQLAPEHRPYIIGVEAPLWTEHIDTYRKAEYMLFPRLMALSEIAWSVPEVKDLKNFKEERLPVHLAWLDTTGIIYRVPEPIGMERDTLYGAEFTVSLKVPVEGGKIYYNFEGQPARETDYLYEKPFRIIVPEGQKRELKAITVAPSGKRSTTATTIFIHQKSK